MSDLRLCACGCGEPTPVARKTRNPIGHVKGQQTKFLRGHGRRADHANHYVVDDDGCWIWQGSCTDNGYGRFEQGHKLVLAHRWFYECHVGPIPDGLHIDHLCRVRACVNPKHLEAVTCAENNRRSAAARRADIWPVDDDESVAVAS